MFWINTKKENPKDEATYSKVSLIDLDDSSDFEDYALSEKAEKRSQRINNLMSCLSSWLLQICVIFVILCLLAQAARLFSSSAEVDPASADIPLFGDLGCEFLSLREKYTCQSKAYWKWREAVEEDFRKTHRIHSNTSYALPRVWEGKKIWFLGNSHVIQLYISMACQLSAHLVRRTQKSRFLQSVIESSSFMVNGKEITLYATLNTKMIYLRNVTLLRDFVPVEDIDLIVLGWFNPLDFLTRSHDDQVEPEIDNSLLRRPNLNWLLKGFTGKIVTVKLFGAKFGHKIHGYQLRDYMRADSAEIEDFDVCHLDIDWWIEKYGLCDQNGCLQQTGHQCTPGPPDLVIWKLFRGLRNCNGWLRKTSG